MSQPGFALVTGASMGLGRSFARALAARNWNLVLVARSLHLLEALASELKLAHHIQAEALSFDLANPGAGVMLASTLKERRLRIDLLVNNAGFGFTGEFLKLPRDQQLQMIHLQNSSVVELTFEMSPAMIKARRGGIINISSMAGFQPLPYACVYSATKSFLTHFSLAIEQELKPFGVKVVTVCPGRLRESREHPEAAKPRRKFLAVKQEHEEVIEDTLAALDGEGGLVIPGFINRFAAFAEHFIPRRAVPKLVAKFTRPKPEK